MTCQLMAGDKVLLEQEYYSVGGGFIEWKGYTPPKKGQPKYPYERMSEVLAACQANNLSLAQLAMANEVAVSGKSEAEVNAHLDKIMVAMRATVKTGLEAPTGTLPGPIKLKTKAHDVYTNALKQPGTARQAIGLVSAYALAGSEENARGHLVITAPTGGSAGVLPAVVYSLGPDGAKLSDDKIRAGLMAAALVGYLCKHNATLSAAEGGCQAEIGVASAMGAALIAQAYDESPQVAANGAEGALEHHLGMTCDPVAGYVQIPCIERCAFGAVKAWTGYLIARNEVPANRRVDLDTTVDAMALTAKEMNSKYKETSEGGLAVSVVLC
jgi:L-serine dehydratase